MVSKFVSRGLLLFSSELMGLWALQGQFQAVNWSDPRPWSSLTKAEASLLYAH